MEKQAIQFFNLRLHSNRSASHTLAMNRTGLLMDNICLPAILHRPSALDHISDLFAALGIIFVVGGSIYSRLETLISVTRVVYLSTFGCITFERSKVGPVKV